MNSGGNNWKMNNYRPSGSSSVARWLLTALAIGLVVGVSIFAIFYFGVFNRGNGPTVTGTPTSTPVTNGSPVVGGTGSMLHVEGSRLLDSSGHTVVLRGAQIESAFNVVHPTGAEQQATANLKSSTFTVMHN
jgi:hypothetical protein